MGVYIKNIKMPKNCWFCPCYNKEFLICQVTDTGSEYEKPDNCPLVEIKVPHGNLGDLDELSHRAFQCVDELTQLSFEHLINGCAIVLPKEERKK